MYLADQHNLLPKTHIGGQKMTSTEHAVHLLLEKIHKAWKRKEVATLLLLDISGVFDNVSHPRLLHNLRKRRIDLKWCNGSARFLATVLQHWLYRILPRSRPKSTLMRSNKGSQEKYCKEQARYSNISLFSLYSGFLGRG
jgi:hypothetical protein